jgi:soluble lytic murein transglycosylase-like protein
MKDTQNQVHLARWEFYRGAIYRRWRVYSTFLTGFLIGLLFVIVIGLGETSSHLLYGFIDHNTLVLIFSGIMGGVIYSILVNGRVEMPRFIANRGDQFEAGLFGDILLGIAGAVVLNFLLGSTSPLKPETSMQVAAVGLIGGYGGRALLQFALSRMFSDIKVLEADRQQQLQASYQGQREAMAGLQVIDQLQTQIQSGLTTSELAELTAAIRSAPAQVRRQVFDLVRDFRRTAKLSETTKPRIERTIPIFEALIDGEPDQHAYYAEAAFAYKDAGSPDLFRALQYLDKAIALRGDRHQADTWKYELSRAITRIQQAYQTQHSYNFDPVTSEGIIKDLLAVAQIYNLENILKAGKEKNLPIPIAEWVCRNSAMLTARPDTQNLAASLLQSSDLLPAPTLPADRPAVEGKNPSPDGAGRSEQPSLKAAVALKAPPAELAKPALETDLARWRRALAQAKPQGASMQTASQDRLNYGGVAASHKMAERDWPKIKPYQDRFWLAARQFHLPPEFLAAIASRESRCGEALCKNNWGDGDQAFGIMQVDKNYHSVAGVGTDPASQGHINQAAGILAGYLREGQKKFPDWDDSTLLEACAVAYNAGLNTVQTRERLNQGTTGNDYGADVMARAQFYSTYFAEPSSQKLVTPIEDREAGLPDLPISLATTMPLKQLDAEQAQWVQKQLKLGGYYPGEVDGQIGSQSLEAFAKFKAEFFLESPDLIGPSTVQILSTLEKPLRGSDIPLSEHFKLAELIVSEVATENKIDNYPTDPVVIENLKAVCENILEPVRAHYGQAITPSSGYRSQALNRVVRGASKTSQHMVGEAVDFNVPGVSVPEVCQWIRQNLDFDQLILEKYSPPQNPGWVHCSYRRNGKNRKDFKRIT